MNKFEEPRCLRVRPGFSTVAHLHPDRVRRDFGACAVAALTGCARITGWWGVSLSRWAIHTWRSEVYPYDELVDEPT